MKKLYLFQANFKTIFDGVEQVWFPYSTACLWAYAQTREIIQNDWELSGIYFRRHLMEEIPSIVKDPDVCGFSVYIWNKNWTLKAAEEIKRIYPNTKIVVGGPEVSSKWLQYDFVDHIFIGEGEVSFANFLENISNKKSNEKIITAKRIDDLQEMPSPYQLGIFDKMIEENPDVAWQATIETNRGCPYSCTFCDWGGLTASKIKKFNLERVIQDVEYLKNHNVKVVYITDANFGIFKERDVSIAKIVSQIPSLDFVSMDYAKNSNEYVFEIASIFGNDIGKGVTLSVQSMNPDTLKAIKRSNMKSNNISEMLKLATKHGLSYYTEFILGLPLETKDSWKKGLAEIIELGQKDRLDIYPAGILDNTELNHQSRFEYRLKTVDVPNFLRFSEQEPEVEESMPVVKSTSTMSTEDMVECMMYSWMYTQFHINQLTRIVSEYCRYIENISFYDFYDGFFEHIKEDKGVVGNQYREVKKGVEEMYSTGRFSNKDLNMSNILVYSSPFMLQYYGEVANCIESYLDKICNIPISLIEIQRRVKVNAEYQSDVTITSPYNIDTWDNSESFYKISSPVLVKEHDYRSRRTKSDWNIIKEIKNGL